MALTHLVDTSALNVHQLTAKVTEYIEDTGPRPLHPADPLERAQRLFPRPDPRPKLTHCTLIRHSTAKHCMSTDRISPSCSTQPLPDDNFAVYRHP